MHYAINIAKISCNSNSNSNSLLVKASLTDCLQYQKTFEMALNKLQISSTNIHGNYS